jgi:Flp pilus assembly protein TadD
MAVAGIAIGGVAIWACWTSFLHSWRLEGSRLAAGTGDMVAAEQRARDAIEVEPWAADARGQLALVFEREGDLARALVAIRSANRTDPWDGNLWFLRARIALTAGNVTEAQRALESARALRPRDPVFSIR